MNLLNGKRILFFAPKFFGYEKEICKEIEVQGGIVKFYDERNSPTSLEKIILRKIHFLLEPKISVYYKKIIKTEKYFNPDYVLFISPETVNKKSILQMRNVFSSAKFILYMWDSIENKNAKKVYKYFDKCLSFDSNDCKKYNFIFRPLFFIKSFEKENTKNDVSYKYDFAFIGSVHSDRAKILNQLKTFLESNELKFFYYIYVPGKLMLAIRSLLDKNFRKLKKNVYLTTVSKQKVSEILMKTNYVIDINHPKQIGLTMRTIEMLGMHRKLLTTNSHIKEYDFFNQHNQIVIDRKSVCFDVSKLINGYIPVSNNVYTKYKISTWLEEIFN